MNKDLINLSVILLYWLFSSCQSQMNEKYTDYKVSESDLDMIYQAAGIVNQFTGIERVSFNHKIGMYCSQLFHKKGALVLDTALFTKKTKDKIASDTEQQEAEIRVIDSAAINLNNVRIEKSGIFYLSNFVYGKIDSINYSSLFVFWNNSEKGWLGIHFYFEKVENDYYQLVYFNTKVDINTFECDYNFAV